MSGRISRREVLGSLVCASTGALVGASRVPAQTAPILIAGRPIEIRATFVSPMTVRISLLPTENGPAKPIPYDGSLVQPLGPPRFPHAKLTEFRRAERICENNLTVRTEWDPLTVFVEDKDNRLVQRLQIDKQTGVLTFNLGSGPVLGLGEGGAQFDRRGNIDQMRNGQGGYRLRTHGGRAAVPWLIGTRGWAMFIHQPLGTFDLTGEEGRFIPINSAAPLPLDIFIVAAREPAQVMSEYARLTGHPEMPPLWSLGYLQSHRTLHGPDEITAAPSITARESGWGSS